MVLLYFSDCLWVPQHLVNHVWQSLEHWLEGLYLSPVSPVSVFYRYHILYNFNENKNVDLKLSFVSSNNSVSEVEYLLYILRCFPFSFELYFFLMRSSHSNDHFPMCNVIIVYSQDVLFLLGFQQFYSKFCVYDFLYIHQHGVCWASWVCNFHQVLEIFN